MKTLYEETNFIHPCFFKVRSFRGTLTRWFGYSYFSSIIPYIPHGKLGNGLLLALTLCKKGLEETKLSEEKSRGENLNVIV